MRHRKSIEDTQPSSRTRRRRRRGSCLARLRSILVLLIFTGGALIGLWLWVNTSPCTNSLILGIDRRPDQSNTVRSDTMLLMAICPSQPRVALLSIPRDLYVEIPGHGSDRINTAHFWGENESKGNGPSLAMQAVERNFGVPVHQYIRVAFDDFRAIIDAAGGIDLVVEKAIVDDAYPTDDYGTIHIEIPAGPQHMNGELALRYARSRHGSSDFDRVKRQQQILIALTRRLTTPQVWPRLPLVYYAIAGNVETDLKMQDLLLMALTLYRVGPEGIEYHVIDREMTQPWTTPTGSAVLLPRWETIHPLIQELFAQ